LFASVIVYVTNVGGQVQRLGIRLAERVQPVAVVLALVVGQDGQLGSAMWHVGTCRRLRSGGWRPVRLVGPEQAWAAT
jgi:hypothetical protein